MWSVGIAFPAVVTDNGEFGGDDKAGSKLILPSTGLIEN